MSATRAIIPRRVFMPVPAMTLTALYRLCITHLGHVRGYSDRTCETYERVYAQFVAFLTEIERLGDDTRHFTGESVERFASLLGERGAHPNTIIHRLSALATLAKFAQRVKGSGITSDPTRTFEWPMAQPTPTQYLRPGELAAFLVVPLPAEQALARDLLMETGVRVSEACRASVKDLHEVDGACFLTLQVKGRGKRQVEFPLSPALAAAIRDRLLATGRIRPEEPILVDRDGNRWHRTALSERMVRIGKLAGITRLRVSAHKLRHTANVIARLAKIDPYTRSQMLGHASPRSLERYEHIVSGELHQARAAQLETLRQYVGGPRV